MSSLQEFVHWLGAGAGARGVRRAAWVAGVAVLALLVGWKQFRGARDEATLLQADIGWQLGTGHGFTTRVKFPQTAAWLEARGEKFAGRAEFPSLAEPPLYPLLVGGAVAVLPGDWRETLFGKTPQPPDGFGGDYLLLALNLALLWLAAWQTHALARRLFDARVALLAALGLLLSAGTWAETIAINGTPLLMVLTLALARTLLGAFAVGGAGTAQEMAGGAVRRAWRWWAAAGGAAGLMFLCDYPAGAAVLVVLGGAWFYPGAGRGKSLVAAALAFALVVAPWVVRNVALTGSPVGLAWHGVALRAGDPTAEPAVARATFSAAAPELSLGKLGNKGLTAMREALGGGLWSGGGIFFTAFFVAGLAYRFRDVTARRLRGAAAALVATLIVAHAFLGSGEGGRSPVAYCAPLLIVFGAGFFAVLVASDARLGARAGWAAAALLALQAAPLARDLLEPRRTHFSYPPYYPAAFAAVRAELAKKAAPGAAWMADTPGGAAWYGGGAVWAQPATLADFTRLARAEPPAALLLTPHTLDRPFFTRLAAGAAPGSWAEIYAGLAAGRLPPAFPLGQPVRLADGLLLLADPRWVTPGR